MKYIRAALMGAVIIALLIPMMSAPTSANGRDGRDGDGRGRGCDEVIFGTLDRDALIGTRCDDVIFGFAGSDLIIGLRGEDRLLGGGGNDVLRDIDGDIDVLHGGRGFDRCTGDLDDIFISCESTRRAFPT